LAALDAWTLPEFPQASTSEVASVVRGTVIRFLPLVSEAVANARAALDMFEPKVLVVGNDITLEGRTGCRVAASRGVLSAIFMHGSLAGDALQSMHCADRVFVYGNVQRQALTLQGMGAERIVVCGSPSLDHRPRQTGQVHPLLQKRLGIGPGDPWLLVATSGPGHRISHHHHRIVIEQLQRLSRALPKVPVVVKLHRKDRLDYYRKALQDFDGTRLVVVAEETYGFPRDIFEWLQGCSVVLTGASMVAVEAMLMDVPVVTMDFCDEIREVDFIDFGATTHVTTAESLEGTVREILAAQAPTAEVNAAVQTYLKAAFHALDGCSSQRGVEALRDIIRDRK
jgi:UDP-N-acetylglucosamine 2-epimerase